MHQIPPPSRFRNNHVVLEAKPRRGKPHQGVKELERRRKQLAREKEKQGIAMPTDLTK